MQAVQAGLRYRWNKTSAETVTADGLQWHGLARGRLLFDRAGTLSLNMTASAGSVFVASWNDTGIGTGDFSGRFLLRHLFLAAQPVAGLELQAGGIAPHRGEVSENLSYDTDGYLMGQRATLRPASGRISQVSATAGHIGDPTQPNVFRRFDDFTDYNYGQILVGLRLSDRVVGSVEYTHEDGYDILRQALVVRTAPSVRVLSGVRLEAYQRVSPEERAAADIVTRSGPGQGFNASADLRFGKLGVTAGVISVDSAFRPLNGDRYGIGKRWYTIGTFPVSSDVAVTWYHTRAFDNAFPVSVHHRFDLIVVVNPTARLKRAGVF